MLRADLEMALRIGIDVGGTHTDAVIVNRKNELITAIKTPTTPDVTGGILTALNQVLEKSGVDSEDVYATMLGTTHCTNAIVERKNLSRIGVLRIGKPATLAVKPLRTFPNDLRKAVGDIWEVVEGGHEYDGREISSLSEDDIHRAVEKFRQEGVEAVAICSVFSPVCPDHERRAADILCKEFGEEFPLTLSHEIGIIGLLERENAAALNAAVTKVATKAIEAFQRAMKAAKLHAAKIFLTQNDGSLMSVEYARKFPIRSVASGSTNSIRGAAFLVNIREGVVVDIGGTTTLVGILAKGFPRESAIAVEIGGVRTNFRMPDLVAVSCGGGTVVSEKRGAIQIGPQSVGYALVTKGVAWGGRTLTTTDIALAAGYADINDSRCTPERLQGLEAGFVKKVVNKIVENIERSIDKIKTSSNPLPVVLVGGGGIIVPPERYNRLKGASKVIRPQYFQFANAIGAAIAQVSGEIDRVFSLENVARTTVLSKAKELACQEALKAGAKPGTVEIVDIDEIPLTYLLGNATRIRVKATGKLAI